MKKNRSWLFLLLAAGLIGLGAGGGTFATFNAQTTNPNNSFATGSLQLRDDTSATACFSWQDNATANNNNNPGTGTHGCGTVLAATNQQPSTGVSGASTGTVTLTNVGTLAGSLTASSSACSDATLTFSETGALTGGTTNATFTVSAATAGATEISGGMSVSDSASQNKLAAGTYVTNVSNSGGNVTVTLSSPGATVTSDTLTFTAPSTSASLCSSLEVYIENGTTSACYVGACPGTTGATPVTLSSLSTQTIFSSAPTLDAQGGSLPLTVGLYLPSGTAGSENDLMGQVSTFSLTFTLTQS